MTDSTPGSSPSEDSGITASPYSAPQEYASAGPQPFPAKPLRAPTLVPRAAENPHSLQKLWMPLFLLFATCLSTFFAGTMTWDPDLFLKALFSGQITTGLGIEVRQAILRNFDQGFVYMMCVVAILFAHEMGHYVFTRIYKVRASYPIFIPIPLTPFGTMGAVIAMENQKADRREIFDIGIAGPLAGLVFAIPIICIGAATLDLSAPGVGAFRFDLPLLARWLLSWFHPNGSKVTYLYSGQVNAMFMAGWFGLLITGLNMLPISQLDGGHVTYTLFGKHSRTIARVFLGVAITYMLYTGVRIWFVMLLLIFAIGIDHPPTSDDTVPLGRGRIVLGAISLLIPVLCFPPRGAF